MKLHEIREAARKALEAARVIQNEHGADMSDEKRAEYEKYMDDWQSLDTRAADVEKLEAAEKRAAEYVIDPERPSVDTTATPDYGDTEKRHNEAFNEWLKNPRSVQNMSGAELRDLQADKDPSGGYLLAPPQFFNDLIRNVSDAVFILDRANVITVTGTDAATFPTLTTLPSDYSWTSEISTQADDTTMRFGSRGLKMSKARKLIKVSSDLLMKASINPDQIIRDALVEVMGKTSETAYMTGDGANQPLGLFTADASGISTSRDISTDNTTTAMTLKGLQNAMYHVKSQYHPNAVWVFSREAVREINKLQDGYGRPLLSPDITRAGGLQLLGHEILMSEYVPNTFTAALYLGVFGDLKQYQILQGASLQIQVASEIYLATDQVGYFAKWHGDGAPAVEEAFARVQLAAS